MYAFIPCAIRLLSALRTHAWSVAKRIGGILSNMIAKYSASSVRFVGGRENFTGWKEGEDLQKCCEVVIVKVPDTLLDNFHAALEQSDLMTSALSAFRNRQRRRTKTFREVSSSF